DAGAEGTLGIQQVEYWPSAVRRLPQRPGDEHAVGIAALPVVNHEALAALQHERIAPSALGGGNGSCVVRLTNFHGAPSSYCTLQSIADLRENSGRFACAEEELPITPANPPRTKVARPPFTVFVLIAVLLSAVAAFTLWRGDTAPSAAPGNAELIDARGRAVTVDGPVDRLAIDDSRYLVALGLLHPDPVSLLVAWPHDVNRLGEDTYRQFLQKSPELAELTTIASSAGEFNVETLLGAAPEVALLSLESGVTEAQVQQLEAAGIRVVFVDFFVKPFENLEPSLRILGRLTGREQQAESFIAFRADRMARIEQAVADLPEEYRPTVFVEAHAGMGADCCNSPGRGNIGDYLT